VFFNVSLQLVFFNVSLQLVYLLQETLQKGAFEALQFQKDIKSQRINGEIALIQAELASLTVVEIERRDFRAEEEMVRCSFKTSKFPLDH